MADLSSSNTIPSVLLEWLKDNIAGEFDSVMSLIKESPNDPESEPYKSLYKARDHLAVMKDKLTKQCPVEVKETHAYKATFAHLKLQFGLNYVQTEETGRGQECFEQIVGEFFEMPLAVYPVLNSLNQLGILWANRSEHDQALKLLLQAKTLYDDCKNKPPPLSTKDVFYGNIREDSLRERCFEDLHTHTLFYLAQVYSHLDQAKVSAEYCQNTLRRQLETNAYDPIEWSLNAATISQYYIGVEQFAQARHCLASAHVVLSRVESADIPSLIKEKVEQAKADFGRCWIKYCIVLLKTSLESQSSDSERSENGNETLYTFEALEVREFEDEIQCELVEDCTAAKQVFLFGQKHIEHCKVYFTLDDLASEHASVIQDYSQLFKLLSCFEPDLSLKCRMHKRRIDMLTGIISEFNPQHFMSLIRQLDYEIAETFRDMTDFKIVISGEGDPLPTTAYGVTKINALADNSIKHFQKFVDSFEGEIDPVNTRSYLTALLNIGRLHSKKVFLSSAEEIECIQKSLNVYKTIVGYKAKLGEDEIKRVFDEEMTICEEMTLLLPMKLNKLK